MQLRSIITESVKRYITESQCTEQWESEIKRFLDGIDSHEAIVEENYIAVPYARLGEDETRYIVYEGGSGRLRDDYFMLQHSRELSPRELVKIAHAFESYGFDPEESMGEDYYYMTQY